MEVKPNYKETEVGMIPEDWEVKSLESIVDPKSPICYGIVQVGPFTNDGVPVLAIKNLNVDYVTDVHRSSISVEMPYVRSRVCSGDLLISVKGTTGRVGIVPQHFDGNISRDLARLRLTDEEIPEFWYQMLQSDTAQMKLNTVAVGTTRMELSIGILKQVQLPHPPKSQQLTIARVLSDADALITTLILLVAKKRDIKQATMQQLLNNQLRLPGFHREWKDVLVRDVITEYFCGPSPTCIERNINGDFEWGVLKTTAATKEWGWDWQKHKVLPKSFWNKAHLELRLGDVIVTKAGPRHRVGVAAWVDYVPPRIIVSGKMIGLRPNPEKVLPLILTAAISAPAAQAYLDQRTTGMAESQVNFENKVLLETPIRIPDIEEQQAITKALTDMNAEIAALEQHLDKIRALKQGMMQELLTGRIRLV